MTTLYKLTDADGYTQRGQRGETLWTAGEWIVVAWGGALCERGCLHAYADPLLAVLLDPVHAGLLPTGRLWVAEGYVRAEDATKVGCDRLRVMREHDVPEVTITQRVRWAIYCASEGYNEPSWQRWAAGWLDGTDRAASSCSAADAAATYDTYAAYAAAAAYDAAFTAARAATYATYDTYAAYAAAATSAADAAFTAAARAATYANAASRAAANANNIDLLRLALQAITEEP